MAKLSSTTRIHPRCHSGHAAISCLWCWIWDRCTALLWYLLSTRSFYTSYTSFLSCGELLPCAVFIQFFYQLHFDNNEFEFDIDLDFGDDHHYELDFDFDFDDGSYDYHHNVNYKHDFE